MEIHRYLVVEDNPLHMEDAKTVLSTWSDEGRRFDFFDDFGSASNALSQVSRGDAECVGLITDVHMSRSIKGGDKLGGHDQPNGLILASMALDIGIPVMLCTSGWHHAHHMEWLIRTVKMISGVILGHLLDMKDSLRAPISMVYSEPDAGGVAKGTDMETWMNDERAHPKPWWNAYTGLAVLRGIWNSQQTDKDSAPR